MGVADNFLEQSLRLEHGCLLSDDSASHCQNRGEDTQVKKNSPVVRDLEVQEDGVDHGDEQEDSSKGAGDEGNESGMIKLSESLLWCLFATYLIVKALISFGNWSMYRLAAG